MLTLGLGTLVITLQDPIIKATMNDYPVMEAVAIRSVVALPIFFILLHRMGGWRVVLQGNTRQAIIRALLFMTAYTTYFLAFPAMPLAEAGLPSRLLIGGLLCGWDLLPALSRLLSSNPSLEKLLAGGAP
jgi:hypothetical protein